MSNGTGRYTCARKHGQYEQTGTHRHENNVTCPTGHVRRTFAAQSGHSRDWFMLTKPSLTNLMSFFHSYFMVKKKERKNAFCMS